MSTSAPTRPAPARPAPARPAPARPAPTRPAAAGIALMTVSAASSQFGAAPAAQGLPVLGPAGVVVVRQWVAAAVLLAAVRPRFTRFTAAQWRPVLTLALVV